MSTGEWLICGILLVAASGAAWRKLRARPSPGRLVRTNVDALPGQTATVIKGIDNDRSVGQVLLDGMEWTARSVDERPIPEGAKVRVISVEGVKLIVEQEY